MKTIIRPALLAITLLTGLNQFASAGVILTEVTPSAKLGSSRLASIGAERPALIVPDPAQLLPYEVLAAPVPMPAPTLDEPATVPEPASVATLAAGLALMAAVTRRRRPLR